jgi:hypothetical protein
MPGASRRIARLAGVCWTTQEILTEALTITASETIISLT